MTTVPGLYLYPDFLSIDEEEWLTEEINNGKWVDNRSKTRRVQIYGPFHDSNYKIIPNKYSKHPEYIGDLVELLFQRINTNHKLSKKLRDNKLTEVYINEYNPGQTLAQHFDHRSTYEEAIIGISCTSDAVLCFSNGATKHQVNIPRRSMYIMTGDSRFKYKHGISKPLCGHRLSITFRTVT